MGDEKREPMSDPDDYILDLSSLKNQPDAAREDAPKSLGETQKNGPLGADGKPQFISVYFRCCNAYARFYRGRDGLAYVGRCPKCLRQGSVPAYEVGKDDRVFLAG